MPSFLRLLYIIVTFKIIQIKTADAAPKLPQNGTFVWTIYEDKICSITKQIQGFIPTASLWNMKILGNFYIKPIEFNANIARLSYKECTTEDCNSFTEKQEVCINECTEKNNKYYSCNFIPTSSLALYTFTGFGDSGCNNNNGLVYPLPLSTACWKLEGSGSMHILAFIERRITVNVYSSDTCTGTILEYRKGFECDQSCIENPINADLEYYQCKYTSSTTLYISLFSFIILYLGLLI